VPTPLLELSSLRITWEAALQERFGILISIGHLNRVRAELGLGSRAGHREKNGSSLAR